MGWIKCNPLRKAFSVSIGYIYTCTCMLKPILNQYECIFKYDLAIENNVE